MTDLSAEFKALAEYRPTHKVRFVTAASLFDGHDAAINIMRRASRPKNSSSSSCATASHSAPNAAAGTRAPGAVSICGATPQAASTRLRADGASRATALATKAADTVCAAAAGGVATRGFWQMRSGG